MFTNKVAMKETTTRYVGTNFLEGGRRLLVLLLVVLVGLAGIMQPAHTQAATAGQDEDVQVYLWPDSRYVETGELVRVEVQVKNESDSAVTNVKVHLPKNTRQYVYTDTSFDTITDTDVGLTFASLPANQEEIRHVYLRVQHNPPFETFYLYASYSWEHEQGRTREIASRRVPVTVKEFVVPADVVEDDGVGYEEVYMNGDGVVFVNDDPEGRGLDNRDPRVHSIKVATYGMDGYEVTWDASDASGIKSYDVQARRLPDGGWRLWKENIEKTQAVLAPTEGKEYLFRIRAVDWAGNTSRWYVSPSTRTLD
jgi:hypothetical protein